MKHNLRPGDPGYMRVRGSDDASALVDRIRAHNAHASDAVTDLATLKAWASDPTRLILIGEMERPGVWLFLNTLEARMFPPSTPLNAAYQLAVLSWQEMAWTTLCVPQNEALTASVTAIAAECRLFIEDVVPLCCHISPVIKAIGHSRPGRPAEADMRRKGIVTWFPVSGENARTLATLPGAKPYTKDEQEALIKAAWWEWDELHGKHREATP
jgi:hypothetical protein